MKKILKKLTNQKVCVWDIPDISKQNLNVETRLPDAEAWNRSAAAPETRSRASQREIGL